MTERDRRRATHVEASFLVCLTVGAFSTMPAQTFVLFLVGLNAVTLAVAMHSTRRLRGRAWPLLLFLHTLVSVAAAGLR